MKRTLLYISVCLAVIIAGWIPTGCIEHPEFTPGVRNARTPTVGSLQLKARRADFVVLEGVVSSANGYVVTERGFVWNTDSLFPTDPDKRVAVAWGNENPVGSYTDTVRNLKPGRKYYFWAYAVNEKGVSHTDKALAAETPDGKGLLRTFAIDGNVRGTTALVGGAIEIQGEGKVQARGVYYSRFNDMRDRKRAESTMQTDSFTCTLTELDISTAYYLQAYVKTSLTEFVGNVAMITTTDGRPQVDSIRSLTIDVNNYVTILSHVIDRGDAAVTDRGFCWSVSEPSPRLKRECAACDDKSVGFGGGQGNSPIVSYLDNLQPNRIYYIRAYATNRYGTTYGRVKVFYTNSDVPIIATADPVVDVRGGTVGLGGQLVSNGKSALVEQGICYSDTYSTPEQLYLHGTRRAAATLSAAQFAESCEGLTGGKKYYVCAYARNADGVGYGEVKTFATPNIFEPGNSTFAGRRLKGSPAYFVIANNAYLLGGDIGSEYTPELTVYNNDTWYTLWPYPGAASKWQTAVYYSGTGGATFVLGGMDRNNRPTNDFYCYIEQSNRWLRYPSGNVDSAYQRTAVAIGYVLYFIGGRGETVYDNIWAYSFVTNAWSLHAQFPVPQYGGVAHVIDGVAYVGLGKDNAGVCNRMLWKSTTMNTWTVASAYPAISGGVLLSTVYKKRIYIVDEQYRIHVYDPATGEWTAKSVVPISNPNLDLHGMFVIDGQIYIGLIGNRLYLYDPVWDN